MILRAPVLLIVASLASSPAIASESGIIDLPTPNNIRLTVDAVDNDAATFDVTLDDVTDTFAIEVVRTPGATGSISVDYAIAGIGGDLPAGSIGTLSWGETETSQFIHLPIDGIGAGYGTISLYNPVGYDGAEVPDIGVGSADVTYMPVLLTGDSWTGINPDNPNMGNPGVINNNGQIVAFYEDYLFSNSYVDILDNVAVGGSGIWGNSYWPDSINSLEERINEEVRQYSEAKLVVVTTAGAFNDLTNQPSHSNLQNWQDAVVSVSDEIEQAGARPIWANAPLLSIIHVKNTVPLLTEYNNFIELYCAAKGYTLIDVNSELTPEGILLAEYDLFDGIHLSQAGADRLGELVKIAIDSEVPNAQADLSLIADSFSIEEGQEFDLNVVRTGDLSGEAYATYSISGRLATPAWGFEAFSWADGEGGIKTRKITIGKTPYDTEATILLGLPGGTAGTPSLGIDSAVLTIRNRLGPGVLSLTAETFAASDASYFDLTATRTSGRKGSAQVHYTITPDWLVEEGESTGVIDWNGGQIGVQSARINIKPVSSDTDATITLSSPSGGLGTPELGLTSAVLNITDALMPGKMAICAQGNPECAREDVWQPTSYTVNEGEQFDIHVKRVGVTDGSAQALLLISQTSLFSGQYWPLYWNPEDPDYSRTKTITVTAPEVDTDEQAVIWLGFPSGSAGIPSDIEVIRDTAVLHILNTD